MPKYTAKQHLINKYEREFADAAIAIVQTPKERRLVRLQMLEATVEILKFLHGNRYVHPRTQVPSSTDLRDRVLNAYNDVRFKGIMRLTKDQFQRIALMLSRSGHFRRGDEHVPLEDIIIQLKVALLRLGSEGISVLMTAWVTGVSVGSVTAYTWRCINALDELFQRYVVWPDNARKAVIKDWYKREHGFAECIGAVDGVPFPLAVGPSWETNAWITRKCDYAMGATAVCDHLGRFIYFATGYVGSTHDALAYKRTQLYTQPDSYFDGQEYILADAAYALTSTVIQCCQKLIHRFADSDILIAFAIPFSSILNWSLIIHSSD